MSRSVVIAAFRSEVEAEDAVATLEAAGITATATGDTASIERRCDGAFEGGIDVVVAADAADEAIAILRRHWPDEAAIDVVPAERCPQCGATDVSRVPRAGVFALATIALLAAGVVTRQRDLFFLVIVILGALLVLMPSRRCRSCGERWRSGNR